MTLPAVFSCAVVALPFLVAACGEGGEREPVDTGATQATTGVPLAQEGAVVSLEVPARAAAGAPVPIKLRVRNATSAPLDLYLRGRDVTFDLTVADSTGDAVWRRLEGEVTQAILQLKTLAPGETMELTHVWNQKSQRGLPVAPGRYTVRGSVLTDGQTTLDSPASAFEITP